MPKPNTFRFEYKGKNYFVAAAEYPRDFPDIQELMRFKHWTRSSAVLSLRRENLVLKEIFTQKHPGGKKFDSAVPYSGGVMLGDGSLWVFNLSGHMPGYAPPLSYNSVLELRFEDGKLTEERDHSEKAKAIRAAGSEDEYEELKAGFPAWANRLPYATIKEAAEKSKVSAERKEHRRRFAERNGL